MTLVNIYEAKTNLSRLLKRVCSGEEIIIGKAGEPIVQMTAYKKKKTSRKPGAWKGKVQIDSDFDSLPKETLDSFYNAA